VKDKGKKGEEPDWIFCPGAPEFLVTPMVLEPLPASRLGCDGISGVFRGKPAMSPQH